jgi:hypothetical protein
MLEIIQVLYLLPVSEVIQRTLLINNTNSGFLSPNPDTLDVFCGLPKLLEFAVDDVSSLYSGLCVELGGVGNLEEDVFHNVRAIGSLELERFTLRMLSWREGDTEKVTVP